jgi:hypothetical protein
MEKEARQEESRPAQENYEPPAVEEVLSAQELEREVLYAGNGSFVIP